MGFRRWPFPICPYAKGFPGRAFLRARVREELLAGVILERSDELGNEAVQIPCPVTSRGESSRGAACRAPALPPQPQHVVERQRPRPERHHCQGGDDQEQVVLLTAVLIE